ncbi:hypothetical protein EK904_000763 [Melospiza melodia maxima]|nr:hypothetical protein EK904_000763 [Melospiza melodia maxima]
MDNPSMDNPTEVSSESAATFSFLGRCDCLGTSMRIKWDEKFLLQDLTSFTLLNAAEKVQGGCDYSFYTSGMRNIQVKCQ